MPDGRAGRASRPEQLTSEIQVTTNNDDEHDGGSEHLARTPTRGTFSAVLVGDSAEAEVLDFCVIRLAGEITDQDHHHGGDERHEEELPEIEERTDPGQRQNHSGRALGLERSQGLDNKGHERLTRLTG